MNTIIYIAIKSSYYEYFVPGHMVGALQWDGKVEGCKSLRTCHMYPKSDMYVPYILGNARYPMYPILAGTYGYIAKFYATLRPPQCRQEPIFHNHFFRSSCPMHGWIPMMLRNVR